jgi:hypothetical protein
MKQTPLNSNSDKECTPAKERLSKAFEKKAVEWPADLPKPAEFPATLKDFFRRIVNAKTPADCMRRLRQFLREKMRHEAMLRDAHWDIPHDQFTEAERDTWAASQIQAINDGDKKGGYFTKGIWLGMGSAYRYWWNDQKSAKASESAKQRKRDS